MAEGSLDGIGVLITRPQAQARAFAADIESRGGAAIVIPAIEITPRDRADVEADVAGLAEPDITIFVSSNAVEHGIDYAGGQLAAVGPATAAAIERAGRTVDICPVEGFDSEHLLAEPAFADAAGKTVRIIRGNPGRELLATTLTERGASVHYLSTYERTLPNHGPALLADVEHAWRAGDVDIVVVMSVQSLQNLGAVLPEWCRLRLPVTPLVTPAARVLKEAQNLYPGCPAYLAASPNSSDLIDAIAAVAAEHAAPG